MKKAKLFIMNTAILIVCSLIIKISVSTFDIYLANKIGAEAIGVYSLLMSIYSLAITIATSGINLATTKVISEELEKNNNVHKVVVKCTIYSLIMGSIAGILFFSFSGYICTNWLNNKIEPLVIHILAISLPFLSMTSAISGYFMAKRNVLRTSISQIFGQFIRMMVVSLLLSYVFPNGINYAALALVIGGTIAEILSFVSLSFTYYINKKKEVNNVLTGKDITSRILKITIPIAVTSYIRSALHTLKHILIPKRLKLSGLSYEKAIANYGVITGMAFPIIMFPSVIVYSYSSLLIPEFSRYSFDTDKKAMKKDIDRLFKITLYFSICVAGILMFYGKEIGKLLYTNENVGWYITIMAPLVVLMYLDNIVDNILKGLGKQVSVMCCNILDLVVSVSFIYFMLPLFGATGYIIVLYISEILNYSISVITLFRTTDIHFKYFDWFVFPVIIITLSIIIFCNLHVHVIFKIMLTCMTYAFFLALNLPSRVKYIKA